MDTFKGMFRYGVAMAALLAPGLAMALTGPEIVQKGHDLNGKGYVGERSVATMTLFDPQGAKTVAYKITTMTLEGSAANGNNTQSLVRFNEPADSKGTALLTHEVDGKEPARWFYLAETRQVKQIAGSAKSSSFKGSEFAYEDMASDTIDQYDYKLLGEAKVDGRPAYILEYKPKFADSGYSKIENAIDTERLMVVQSKFYDKTGKLLKVGTYTQFKQVDGRWRPFQVEMKNVQSQRRTVTSIEDIKMGLKLSENLFTVSQLQKE